MKKVYFSKNKQKIVFSVKNGNTTVNVSFANFGGSYSTSDEELQKEIENTFYYKKGIIYCIEATQGKKKGKKPTSKDDTTITEHPEVTDINGAMDVLSETYGIDVSKIETPEDVLSAAVANNISFPNLVLE